MLRVASEVAGRRCHASMVPTVDTQDDIRSLKYVVRSPCQAVTMTLTTNVVRIQCVFISMHAR